MSRLIDPTIRRVSPHSKLLKNIRELIQWLHMQKHSNADGCTAMLAWIGQCAWAGRPGEQTNQVLIGVVINESWLAVL